MKNSVPDEWHVPSLQVQGGERLDVFVAQELSQCSRARAQKLISAGAVRVNGVRAKAAYRLVVGDDVSIRLPAAHFAEISPELPMVPLLSETAGFLVVNKPSGMAVHPGEGGAHAEGTLAQVVASRVRAGTGEALRAGIVHRLDKDTSGIMLVARTPKAYEYFVQLFKARGIEKRYLTLVKGEMPHPRGVIEAPIGRSSGDRKKMAVHTVRGKVAVSRYEVRGVFSLEIGVVSLLEVSIETGRTHQIRVHMAAIGHPVVGDRVYGVRKVNRFFEEEYGLLRQFLHASSLSFVPPGKKKAVTFTAPLAEDLGCVLERIR